jgi:hypothetical protein
MLYKTVAAPRHACLRRHLTKLINAAFTHRDYKRKLLAWKIQ